MKPYRIEIQRRMGDGYATMIIRNRETGADVAEYRVEPGRERAEVAAMRRTLAQTYKNISERWGDAVGGLTVEDFRAQAVIFDADPDKITADTEHVYYAGKIIADAE